MDNQVVVSDYNAMDRVLREERAYILNVAKQVKKAGCNVLLVQKSILRLVSWFVSLSKFQIHTKLLRFYFRDAVSDLALHFLDKMKIMVVKDVERENIEFICKVFDWLDRCSLVYIIKYSISAMTFIFIFLLLDSELPSHCQLGPLPTRISSLGWFGWIRPNWNLQSRQGKSFFSVLLPLHRNSNSNSNYHCFI